MKTRAGLRVLPGEYTKYVLPLLTRTKSINNVRRDIAQRGQSFAKLVEVEAWPRACPCLAERSPQPRVKLS